MLQNIFPPEDPILVTLASKFPITVTLAIGGYQQKHRVKLRGNRDHHLKVWNESMHEDYAQPPPVAAVLKHRLLLAAEAYKERNKNNHRGGQLTLTDALTYMKHHKLPEEQATQDDNVESKAGVGEECDGSQSLQQAKDYFSTKTQDQKLLLVANSHPSPGVQMFDISLIEREDLNCQVCLVGDSNWLGKQLVEAFESIVTDGEYRWQHGLGGRTSTYMRVTVREDPLGPKSRINMARKVILTHWIHVAAFLKIGRN